MIVNLEPCTMCAAAIVQSRIGKIVYSTPDKKRGGFGGSIDLSSHQSAHHKILIIKGIYEQESKKLIQEWFKKLRSQR